jgi:peroxiredoxin
MRVLGTVLALAFICFPRPSLADAPPTTQPAGAVEVKVGDAPALSFKPVNGEKDVSLADYRGKPVLVEFFATWCPLCMAHFKQVTDLGKKHGDDLQVVLISLDGDKNRLGKFIDGKRITWPVYFDGKGWNNDVYTTWYAGRNEGIPRSYVIGADGTVSFVTFSHEGLEAAVDEAVAQAKATKSAAAR